MSLHVVLRKHRTIFTYRGSVCTTASKAVWREQQRASIERGTR